VDNLLTKIGQKLHREDLPVFKPGDTLRVLFKVSENDGERTQIYEGIVIARAGSGIAETFTLRKISYGVGVEVTLPLKSPCIERIEVLRAGKVRRAKLYYLRKKVGKKARVKEERG